MFVGDFQNGLKADHFNMSLAQNSDTSMEEVISRVECYVNGEESNMEKRSRMLKKKHNQGTKDSGLGVNTTSTGRGRVQ